MAAALLSCSLLAACGGGGGGGGGTTPPPPSTPTPGSGAGQRSVIRSDAQAILNAGKVLSTGGYSAGGPPLGAMAVARRLQSARHTEAVQCSSGGGSGVGSVSVSQSTDAQGNLTQVYTDYYDTNCQQTERVATLTFPPGSSLSSGTASGSTTEEDHSGAVIGYATFQSSYNQNTLTVQTADAKTAGGTIVGRSGVTCNVTGQASEICGLATFATVGGTTTGVTASITESFTTTNNGQSSTASAQLTGTTYSGSGLALVPPSSGTAWGLSGGTQMDSITGTGSASYSGSIETQGSYSITDSTAGYSASGSISGSALTLTINLVQGSTSQATIVIDADGNGTITYTSDGTKENVAGFTIFG